MNTSCRRIFNIFFYYFFRQPNFYFTITETSTIFYFYARVSHLLLQYIFLYIHLFFFRLLLDVFVSTIFPTLFWQET